MNKKDIKKGIWLNIDGLTEEVVDYDEDGFSTKSVFGGTGSSWYAWMCLDKKDISIVNKEENGLFNSMKEISSKGIDPEIQEVINDHWWEMLGDDKNNEAQAKAILNREDADYIIHRLEKWFKEHGNENPFIKDNIHCFLYGEEENKPMYKVGDTIHYNSFGEPKSMVVANVIDTGDGNPMYEDEEGNSIFEKDLPVKLNQFESVVRNVFEDVWEGPVPPEEAKRHAPKLLEAAKKHILDHINVDKMVNYVMDSDNPEIQDFQAYRYGVEDVINLIKKLK